MDLWSCIFFFLSLSTLCICRDVSYNELKTLGVNCTPYDTCNTTSRNLDQSRRNCECDIHCAYFGDCCMDAPNPRASKSVAITSLFCQKVLPTVGYFTISKCRRGWRNIEMKRKCENEPNPEDPLSYVPVISAITTFTYKNQYCATCNDVQGNLLYWKMGVDCPGFNESMGDYVHRNLAYDRNQTSWGVHVGNEFRTCLLNAALPNQTRYLRFCYPNLISKCSSRWTDEFIREKCESYTAYIHIRESDITYRNPHCAICNFVDRSKLSCESTFRREFERTSFTTLFDINLEKGNAIGSGGTAPKCKKGEAYDPAFERCQELTCGLPFLELRNGVCVPKK